jgi:predicted nucleic acid-binding protein
MSRSRRPGDACLRLASSGDVPRPINDMWIVACCLTCDLPLATLNFKDYEDFKVYHGLRILSTE